VAEAPIAASVSVAIESESCVEPIMFTYQDNEIDVVTTIKGTGTGINIMQRRCSSFFDGIRTSCSHLSYLSVVFGTAQFKIKIFKFLLTSSHLCDVTGSISGVLHSRNTRPRRRIR
jgi:hypothetical protein